MSLRTFLTVTKSNSGAVINVIFDNYTCLKVENVSMRTVRFTVWYQTQSFVLTVEQGVKCRTSVLRIDGIKHPQHSFLFSGLGTTCRSVTSCL